MYLVIWPSMITWYLILYKMGEFPPIAMCIILFQSTINQPFYRINTSI